MGFDVGKFVAPTIKHSFLIVGDTNFRPYRSFIPLFFNRKSGIQGLQDVAQLTLLFTFFRLV